MKIFNLFAAAVLLPLGLGACQMTQTGSSTFAGTNLAGDPVKRSASVNSYAAPTDSERSSSKKVAPQGLPANEAASLIVKPEDRVKPALKKTPRVFENEAASLLVKKPDAKAAVATITVREGSVASPREAKSELKVTGPKSSKRYHNLIAKHARAQGVPVRLAMAVVQVESNFRPNARGSSGEIGLMQIMPRTARYIGYSGKMKNLYHPETNISYGMKYLAKAHRLGGGSVCGTILKYNAGHGAKKMNPISRKYCQRVHRIMKQG